MSDHFMFYQTTKGGPWKYRLDRQCDKSLGFATCQGVEGHDGDHWVYRPDGSYLHSSPDGSISSTPPIFDTWISPKDKIKEHYLSHPEYGMVTDPAIIKILNSGEVPEGNCGVIRDYDVTKLREYYR